MEPNPTAHWRAEPGLRPEFDFGRHALCGVKIGDPVEWLAKLGPAEDPRAARREGRYCYYSKGLEIGANDGRVISYLLVWGGSADPRYRPFAGACTYRGRSLPLSAQTGEREIVGYFGDPYWRGEEGIVNAVAPPLLADEAQRRAYRVTKPWPPERI